MAINLTMSARSTRSARASTARTRNQEPPVKTEQDFATISNSSAQQATGKSTARSTRSRVKPEPPPLTPNTSRKRKRAMTKQDITEKNPKFEKEDTDKKPPPKAKTTAKSKAAKSGKKPSEKDLQAGADMAKQFLANRDSQRDESPGKTSARAKSNPYGLSPGESPYPTYPHPTPEECQEVNRLLQEVHGKVQAPKTLPTPSLNSSGCGEVPSVLDALVRTRLSAATNGANSSRAFRGLVEKFGVIKEGVGKGSVDWDRVRRAPIKNVFEAIKSGGLADVKSKDIQKILNLVHEENQERKKVLEKDAAALEDQDEAAEEKHAEIQQASNSVLSLDHLHLLSNDDAFNRLLGYPGIGPKTASCVLLFCMQRPSFAVDTHVFRLTRWLGWTPPDQTARGLMKRGECKSAQVTRNSTYAHLDVRIPDDLKYPLHYLFIRHGKNCGWCSAKAGKESKVGTCPLAHLMKGKGRSKGLAKGDSEVDDAEEDDHDDADVKEEDGA